MRRHCPRFWYIYVRFFSEPILSVVDPSPHPATVHGDLFIQWRILSNANLLKYDDTPLPNSPCMLATLRSDQTGTIALSALRIDPGDKWEIARELTNNKCYHFINWYLCNSPNAPAWEYADSINTFKLSSVAASHSTICMDSRSGAIFCHPWAAGEAASVPTIQGPVLYSTNRRQPIVNVTSKVE